MWADYHYLSFGDSSFLSLSAETDVRNPQTVAPLEMESEDDMHDAYDGDYMDESDGIVGFVDDGDYGFVDNATDDLDDPDLSSGRPQGRKGFVYDTRIDGNLRSANVVELIDMKNFDTPRRLGNALHGYIHTSINDGPGCLTLRCPDPSCVAAVGQDLVLSSVCNEDRNKYMRYLLRSYVEDNRKTKWCPAPGCEYAVDFVLGSGCYDITCKCSYIFCWNCTEEAHRPVDCGTVTKWISKNSAESENMNWAKALTDLQQMQAVQIETLSDKQCQPVSQLKFVTDAWLQIVECRRVLKWTYAYGYYLPEQEHAERQFLEYLQGEAEAGLERLHQCTEKELQAYLEGDFPSKDFNEFRTRLAGLTSVTRNYFENLVRALENGLSDVNNSQAAGSRTSTSKASSGNKGKGGFLKVGTSKSRSSRNVDNTGLWSCSHCTFANASSVTVCSICSRPR